MEIYIPVPHTREHTVSVDASKHEIATQYKVIIKHLNFNLVKT